MIKTIAQTDRVGRKDTIARIRNRSVVLDRELMSTVAAIIDDVRQRGDAALIDYTARFDGVRLRRADLRVDEKTLRESAARVSPAVLEALREVIANVRAFHERQVERSWQFSPRDGVVLGQRIAPVERAGLYVPGGTAAYPSSDVMNVVPAQVAGVQRIIVATPPRTIADTPAVAAALVELKVTEVYGIGGAQAIAAMAFGTETIPSVDKITGPGNKYVAAAKKLVFGQVGIDAVAGPSEIVIIADEAAPASFVAADLLAQAEHAEDASSVLVTNSAILARAVTDQIERQVEDLLRKQIIKESLQAYGAIFVVTDLNEACAVVNELAPEHLEIMAREEEAIAAQIKSAGAIFFGASTPEALGDYFAGPNHVLPTGGTARFSSALGVYDFLKRTSMLRYSFAEFSRAGEKIAALAEAEGLTAHARSVEIRLK
ncbi:MAG TPA: histidinol dehydrogenase [Pyrinomonadaceae bacterium]|nr:histidinol dehydrogenase [Pyrinomonadaceae bacterium]